MWAKLKTDWEASSVAIPAARGALLALPLILYIAIPTRNFYWDGVAFAVDIEKHLPFGSLVHPSHLLYKVWGAWLFRMVEALGINTRCLFVLQAANGVLAGISVVLLYKSLRRRSVGAGFALAGAFLFAFSATWWKFATDADAYIPSIALLLFADLLLEHRRTAVAVAAGLAHAGAMLFHELAILFLPVALFRLRKNPKAMAAYFTAAFLPVVLAYVAAYRAAVNKTVTLPGLLRWVTSYSPDSGFSFSWGTDALVTVRGTARLLFGGKLRDFSGDALAIGAGVALVLAAVVFLIRLWRATRETTKFQPPPPSLHVALWAGIYIVFLFFWMPVNTFYRLFYWPPLIMLAIGMMRPTSRARDALWAFIAVVLLWNFSFSIYPQSHADYNVPLRFALAQREKWPAGTPIVFHRFHPDLWTISYFNPQVAWVGFEDLNMAKLDETLEYAHRVERRLWLEETAYDLIAADPRGQSWLRVHERRDELLDFSDPKHRFTFHSVR